MNHKYKIITDITCDLSAEELCTIDVIAMPLHVMIDGEDYTHYADYRNLSYDNFLIKLQNCNKIQTSQLDADIAEKTMRSILSEGYDILYIAFSSTLSGTCSTGRLIAQTLTEDFCKSKIYVVDSCCASGGLGMLVYLTTQKRDSGASFEELCTFVEKTKHKIAHWFTVDDLYHLHKGGRLSAGATAIGNILKLKPILYINTAGKLVTHSKVSGKQKAWDALINKVERYAIANREKNLNTIFVSYSCSDEEAYKFKKKLLNKFKIEKLFMEHIDPVIAAHTGYGGIAVFFLEE